MIDGWGMPTLAAGPVANRSELTPTQARKRIRIDLDIHWLLSLCPTIGTKRLSLHDRPHKHARAVQLSRGGSWQEPGYLAPGAGGGH